MTHDEETEPEGLENKDHPADPGPGEANRARARMMHINAARDAAAFATAVGRPTRAY